jgi:dUTP pyrophosphatase
MYYLRLASLKGWKTHWTAGTFTSPQAAWQYAQQRGLPDNSYQIFKSAQTPMDWAFVHPERPAQLCFHLSDEAKIAGLSLPTRAYETSAGFDIQALHHSVLSANLPTSLHTGLTIEFPPGVFGLLATRSNHARQGLRVEGGVIDPDYRGEIIVVIRSDTVYYVESGEKIAQLLVLPLLAIDSLLVGQISARTPRGARGFGSSGK